MASNTNTVAGDIEKDLKTVLSSFLQNHGVQKIDNTELENLTKSVAPIIQGAISAMQEKTEKASPQPSQEAPKEGTQKESIWFSSLSKYAKRVTERIK